MTHMHWKTVSKWSKLPKQCTHRNGCEGRVNPLIWWDKQKFSYIHWIQIFFPHCVMFQNVTFYTYFFNIHTNSELNKQTWVLKCFLKTAAFCEFTGRRKCECWCFQFCEGLVWQFSLDFNQTKTIILHTSKFSQAHVDSIKLQKQSHGPELNCTYRN